VRRPLSSPQYDGVEELVEGCRTGSAQVSLDERRRHWTIHRRHGESAVRLVYGPASRKGVLCPVAGKMFAHTVNATYR
jgi:hypothetical protein